MEEEPGLYWVEKDKVFRVHYHNLIFLIVMDSVRPDQFNEADTPNMDGGGFKKFEPAYAGAMWTTPSVMHMMTGRLPFHNGSEQIFPHIYWLPDWVHEQGAAAHFLSAACPPMHAINYHWDTFFFPSAGQRWVEVFVEKALYLIECFPNEKQFFYIHLEETHSPYECRDWPNPDWRIEEIMAYNHQNAEIEPEYFEYLKERQRKCITHVDSVLKPLIDIPSTMIITADHGECFGESHYFGHDCPLFVDLLEVPLLERI